MERHVFHPGMAFVACPTVYGADVPMTVVFSWTLFPKNGIGPAP